MGADQSKQETSSNSQSSPSLPSSDQPSPSEPQSCHASIPSREDVDRAELVDLISTVAPQGSSVAQSAEQEVQVASSATVPSSPEFKATDPSTTVPVGEKPSEIDTQRARDPSLSQDLMPKANEGDGSPEALAPDVEHIVSSGAAEPDVESMEALRDAVRKAREASGMPREPLPPGFEAEPEPVQGQASKEMLIDGTLREEDKEEEDEDKEKERTGSAISSTNALAPSLKRSADESVDAQEAKRIKEKNEPADDGQDPEDVISDLHDPDARSMLNRAIESLAEGKGIRIDMEEKMDSDSDTDSDADSSDDSSSSSDSSDEDEAEVLRALDQGDGLDLDDDDDEEVGGGGSRTAPVTKNEIVSPTIEAPPMKQLGPEELESIRRLGRVHSIVDSVVVIEQDVESNGAKAENGKGKMVDIPVDRDGRKGEDEGQYSVLDTGSLVCFEDGKVIGLVFETFGSIFAPMYSVRFASAADIDKALVYPGRPVHYLPSSSTYVMTRALRAMKGSDASNIWDEEVAEDEVEYSDDEEEAEAKRRAKAIRSGNAEGAEGSGAGKGKKGKGKAKGKSSGGLPPTGSAGKHAKPHAGNPTSAATTLPSRVPAALPPRPNFDMDAPPSTEPIRFAGGGRTMLSYGDADMGGDGGSPSGAGVSGREAGKRVSGDRGRGSDRGSGRGRGRGRGMPVGVGSEKRPPLLPPIPKGSPPTASRQTPAGTTATTTTPSSFVAGYGGYQSSSSSSHPSIKNHLHDPYGTASSSTGGEAHLVAAHYNPLFAGQWNMQPAGGAHAGHSPAASAANPLVAQASTPFMAYGQAVHHASAQAGYQNAHHLYHQYAPQQQAGGGPNPPPPPPLPPSFNQPSAYALPPMPNRPVGYPAYGASPAYGGGMGLASPTGYHHANQPHPHQGGFQPPGGSYDPRQPEVVGGMPKVGGRGRGPKNQHDA